MTMTAASKRRVVTKPSAKPSCWRLTTGEQRDGGADAGEGVDQVEEAAQEHAGVRAGADDVVRVVQHGVEEQEGGDRGGEGDDVEGARRRARSSSVSPSGLCAAAVDGVVVMRFPLREWCDGGSFADGRRSSG